LANTKKNIVKFFALPSWAAFLLPLPLRKVHTSVPLHAVADLIEFVGNLVAEASHRRDCANGNQRCDERVLDKVLPGFVGQKTSYNPPCALGSHSHHKECPKDSLGAIAAQRCGGATFGAVLSRLPQYTLCQVHNSLSIGAYFLKRFASTGPGIAITSVGPIRLRPWL
jgi:hypothetical protein